MVGTTTYTSADGKEYVVSAKGQRRHKNPIIRGKAAVKAHKRLRRQRREYIAGLEV